MNDTSKTLAKLADSLEDCVTPAEHVLVIREIARTQDPDAIALLVPLLESCGDIAVATVEALLSFGQLVEAPVRRCVVCETVRIAARGSTMARGEMDRCKVATVRTTTRGLPAHGETMTSATGTVRNGRWGWVLRTRSRPWRS